MKITDDPTLLKYILKLKKEKKELERRVDKATKMVHNIRSYSEVYTPIKEGCEEVLRVLKGRDS